MKVAPKTHPLSRVVLSFKESFLVVENSLSLHFSSKAKLEISAVCLALLEKGSGGAVAMIMTIRMMMMMTWVGLVTAVYINIGPPHD